MRWLEAELPRARVAFTTRIGGVSEGPYRSLNLGSLTEDEPSAVYENRQRLAAALRLDPGCVLIGRQVHGAELQRSDTAPAANAFSDPDTEPTAADGQITSEQGLAPLVFVADCLPVALARRGEVAMIHCGWRGLANGIVSRAVNAIGADAAAIGPGIGPCCYEVGEEVLSRFETLGRGIATGRMLDLREIVRRLLEASGVTSVEIAPQCTSCEAELFFSHRRDRGATGRQAGVAWIV